MVWKIIKINGSWRGTGRTRARRIKNLEKWRWFRHLKSLKIIIRRFKKEKPNLQGQVIVNEKLSR